MGYQQWVPVVGWSEPAPRHVELILASSVLAAAIPGQFAHIVTPGSLRRPISFSRLDPAGGTAGILLQVVGPGTAWLAERRPGDRIDVMGPLGRGFSPPRPDAPWCLVGGGVGIPPLYAAVQRWAAGRANPPRVILGARSADRLLLEDEFRQLGAVVSVSTDDGSKGTPGTVTGPLARWLDDNPDGQVYACGPTPMLGAVAATARGRGPVQLALEQRMGCGIGACLACVVPARTPKGPGYRRVCVDGPVFEAEELIFS